MIGGAALLAESAVLDESERAPGREHTGGLTPAHVGVEPLKRRGREQSAKTAVRERCVFEARVHELDPAATLRVALGERQQVLAGLDGHDVEAAGGQAARQLPAAAPDLEHAVAFPHPGDPAGPSDKLVGIGGAVAVVLGRHLVEDFAVRDSLHPRWSS